MNPDLVARDENGRPYTVRYEAVNAMLLNEFLKAHRRIGEEEVSIDQVRSTVARQEGTIARQQKEIKALTAALKEQAAQMQAVSEELKLRMPAPRVVATNQ